MGSTKGTLGPVSIVLPAWLNPEERYQRRYIGVTPASREIPGGDDKIAPETDIAQWAIQDFSGGEGDLQWKDSGRYNYGTGCGPASDGSGVVLGHNWATTASSGNVHAVSQGGSSRYVAGEMDGNIQIWSGGALTADTAIGGAANDFAVSIAAGTSEVFIIDEDQEIRAVNVDLNSNSTHYAAGSGVDELIAYADVIYALDRSASLYELDQSTTDTKTEVVATGLSVAAPETGRVRYLATSDVGPIWYEPSINGQTLLWEYNKASDTGYVIGELPKDVYAYDIAFYSGVYFVAFRQTMAHNEEGDAYLYYQSGASRGVVGPFRDSGGTSTTVSIAGVIGDRIYVVAGPNSGLDYSLWAYDLSSGGVVLAADLTSHSANGMATVRGPNIFVCGDDEYTVVETREYKGADQYLYTGRYDYGYLGLPKLVHTVTCVLESPKTVLQTVRVGYITDGGATTWLDDDFAAGTSSHTWTVSDSSADVTGTEIEWVIWLNSSSSASSPKVIALYSDVSGAAARIEWAVAVDVGESSVNDGGDVISALNSLRTTYGVVQWSDPYQVDSYTADQSFDVRVKDVRTPELSDDGHLYATVVFQTIGTVGP